MTDNIEWKSYYQQEPIQEDIYFKFACFYMAMAELYDRRLTDARSPYDETEAFISEKVRGSSELYVKNLYDCVVGYIWHKTKTPFDINRWKKQVQKRYSAQGWIDVFEHFKKEKDEVILDMIENVWDYEKTRNDKREQNSIIIKNPFWK